MTAYSVNETFNLLISMLTAPDCSTEQAVSVFTELKRRGAWMSAVAKQVVNSETTNPDVIKTLLIEFRTNTRTLIAEEVLCTILNNNELSEEIIHELFLYVSVFQSELYTNTMNSARTYSEYGHRTITNIIAHPNTSLHTFKRIADSGKYKLELSDCVNTPTEILENLLEEIKFSPYLTARQLLTNPSVPTSAIADYYYYNHTETTRRIVSTRSDWGEVLVLFLRKHYPDLELENMPVAWLEETEATLTGF